MDGTPGTSASAVASHSIAAGDLVDPSTGRGRLERAAASCLDAGGYEEALRWVTEAERSTRTVALTTIRIRALLRLGRAAEALAPLSTLLETGDETTAVSVRAITGDLAGLTNPMTYRLGAPLLAITDRAFAITRESDPAWPRVALGWARSTRVRRRQPRRVRRRRTGGTTRSIARRQRRRRARPHRPRRARSQHAARRRHAAPGQRSRGPRPELGATGVDRMGAAVPRQRSPATRPHRRRRRRDERDHRPGGHRGRARPVGSRGTRPLVATAPHR